MQFLPLTATNSALPIDQCLPELAQALAQSAAVVLQAAPGAGKTTRVPLALLDAPWLQGQKILMLEPRRLAARAAAMRMATQLGEKVGESIGYRVRFDHKVSAQTRVEVVTEGILTQRLQGDPELEGVGLIIFDEYHERSLDADLALALCLDVQQGLREDLKILVMSATLDSAALCALLDDAPFISSPGKSFPVSIDYRPPADDKRIADNMAQAICSLLDQHPGDVLAFLPGAGEIRRTAQLLSDSGLPAHIHIAPLYGDLSRAEQDAAIQPAPAGQRKIVLATPIAETSLTIEGVRLVIDSGWQRSPQFDPRTGMSRLTLQRISLASAEQRRGRAGRVAEGHCCRLWAESQNSRLPAHHNAEILSADLAPLLLDLAQWGVSNPQDLRWLDAPPPGALAQARDLLQRLDALDEKQHITATGQRMNQWPLHPRLAHLLAQAEQLGCVELACDIAALLSERDILRRRPGQSLDADLRLRLQALRAFRQGDKNLPRSLGADAAACARVQQIAKQLQQSVKNNGAETYDEKLAGLLLAFAYPDRVAQARANDPQRYRLASGRGAALPDLDRLVGEAYLVVADVDGGEREARIYLAAPLDIHAFREHCAAHIQAQEAVVWDKQQQAVRAERQECYAALVLSREDIAQPSAEAISAALLQGVQQQGLTSLNWDETALSLQARVAFLAEHAPEQGWPDWSLNALSADLDWLAPYLHGLRKLSQVQSLNLAEILLAQLDWNQQQALEQNAPTHIQVPSGSRIRLDYSQPVPVLAVRLQEMFGLNDTPRLLQGRVPCMLHLLSPARRPVQVTQDLAGFWKSTYAEVKKELKGRYPKHYWPDDPYQAVASRHVKPRKAE